MRESKLKPAELLSPIHRGDLEQGDNTEKAADGGGADNGTGGPGSSGRGDQSRRGGRLGGVVTRARRVCAVGRAGGGSCGGGLAQSAAAEEHRMELTGQDRGRCSRRDAARDVGVILADMFSTVAKEARAVALELGQKRRGKVAGDAAEQRLISIGVLQGKIRQSGGLAGSGHGTAA